MNSFILIEYEHLFTKDLTMKKSWPMGQVLEASLKDV